MGDQNTIINEEELRHAIRRAAFDPSSKQMALALRKVGSMTRGGAADYLQSMKRKVVKARGKSLYDVHNKWMKHILKGKTSYADKQAIFWHDHFSVTASVVGREESTTRYISRLYSHCDGSFGDFLKSMNRDPSMMRFLNTTENTDEEPNENYARELMELFAIGTHDENGNENYVQADVAQAARGFTGWRLRNDDSESYLSNRRHDFMADYPERGPKVLFDNAHGFPAGGVSFTQNGEGENEIGEIIDILLQHTDSDGRKTAARYVTRRLTEFYCYAGVDIAAIDEIIDDSGFDLTWDIPSLMRSLMCNDVFYATAASAPFSVDTKKSVKHPVDFIVGAMNVLAMKPKGKELEIARGDSDGRTRPIEEHSEAMGQILLDPPSVFGWDWEEGWISGQNLLGRNRFCRDLTSKRYGGKFRPERLVDMGETDPGAIVDQVTNILGIQNQFTATERDELINYLTDGGINPVIDLNDEDVLHVKLCGLFYLTMSSSQYQVQ